MKKFLATILCYVLLATTVAIVPAVPQTNQSGPVTQVVAFSATPTFNASQANTFVITLTGNVTSSTLAGGYVGEIVTFIIQQDATGGRTYVYPTNVGGAPNVLAAASAITRFQVIFDGGEWQAFTPITLQQIAAYSNATTSATSIPEIGFSVAPNRNYSAVCRMTWSSSNAAAAPSYQFTGPGSPTAVVVGLSTPVTSSTLTQASATAFSSFVANAATVTTSTNFTDILSVSVQNGTNAGTVQLQMKSTSASGTVTMQPGSGCIVTAQ